MGARVAVGVKVGELVGVGIGVIGVAVGLGVCVAVSVGELVGVGDGGMGVAVGLGTGVAVSVAVGVGGSVGVTDGSGGGGGGSSPLAWLILNRRLTTASASMPTIINANKNPFRRSGMLRCRSS